MSNDINRRNFLQRSAAAVGAVHVFDANITSPGFVPESTAPMPTSILGRTGRTVSRLAFGGGSRYFLWVPSERDAEKLVDQAIKFGITYFDTAHSYGENSESEIRYGKYLTPKYRSQIFLVTKTNRRTYDGVMKDFEASLENLKTDHVDLYHMHAMTTPEDVESLLASDGGLKAFQKLKDSGAIKNIGFSCHANWDTHIKKAYQEIDPDVVMLAMNAARDTGLEEHLLPMAKERKTGVVLMKVTGQNALIGKLNGKELVRYAFSVDADVFNVGMDGYTTLESCVELIKEKPISNSERERLHKSMAYTPEMYDLPYHRPGYRDGCYT